MKKNDQILVLGASGMVGSAITRELKMRDYQNILAPTRLDLNLLNQQSTLNYFEKFEPQHIFLAAGLVGGIHANNTYRADFIHQNIIIQSNVFEAAFQKKIDKLLFLGSSCIYPKNAPCPIKEESLLTSPLEPTNEPYAIAKIAGLKIAENFRNQYNCNYFSAMPTNLYGENDNFHLENSHVIPGLIARMKKAMNEGEDTFTVWGTGLPRRDFLYVGDMAKACIHIMEYKGRVPDLINVGSGEDISINELAYKIKEIIGFKGKIIFNLDRPDGTSQKLLDISRIKNLGWKPLVNLDEGLRRTISYYINK